MYEPSPQLTMREGIRLPKPLSVLVKMPCCFSPSRKPQRVSMLRRPGCCCGRRAQAQGHFQHTSVAQPVWQLPVNCGSSYESVKQDSYPTLIKRACLLSSENFVIDCEYYVLIICERKDK